MTEKVALFELAGKGFVLPVSGIEHIVPIPRVFFLPLLRDGFAGVFVDRHEVVPFLDLWRVFGVSLPYAGRARYTVVCGSEAGPVGLPAGQILGIINRQEGHAEAAAGSDAAGFDRIFVHAGRRYPLLDVEKLLTSLPY